jgi:hypothetical protein
VSIDIAPAKKGVPPENRIFWLDLCIQAAVMAYTKKNVDPQDKARRKSAFKKERETELRVTTLYCLHPG